MGTMSGYNPDKITKVGCVVYLTSWIESLNDRINKGDPRKLLYEEQIAFLSKAVEELDK